MTNFVATLIMAQHVRKFRFNTGAGYRSFRPGLKRDYLKTDYVKFRRFQKKAKQNPHSHELSG